MGIGGVSILMYHQVGDFAPMKSHRSTYCHYKSFSRQMHLLKALRFRVVDMDAILDHAKGKRHLPKRTVCLTFDDGYENFYQYAFPVLKRLGLCSTVFLLAGYIGKDSTWFREDGRDTPPLMTQERINTLMESGLVTFGSHGVYHKRLGDLPEDAAHFEVFHSKKALEAMFKREFKHFCYPYGSYNRAVMKMVQEAGYYSAVSCARGAVWPGSHPYQLPRKAISYGDSLIGFLWKLLFKNRRKQPEL